MKPKALVLLLCLLTFCTIAFAQEIPLQFAQPKGAPYLESQLINADSNEYNTVLLKIKAGQNGMAQLFWATSYDPQFNQYKTVAFPLKRGIHKYTINVPSQNSNWIGWVRKVILLSNVPTELRSATIIKGNLFTNIASGWQEFWGPRGRLIIGSTINTIQSPNLFGRSIFAYIYWIIALLAIILISWDLYKYKNLKKAGIIIFWIIIGFWITLELSSLINNWNQAKSELKFIGKSLDEKTAMVNFNDFYPFIMFCQENIPQNSTFDFKVSGIYHNIKTKYYLYPRKHTTIEANYLIVYDSKTDNKQYSPYKEFRKGAYILKK